MDSLERSLFSLMAQKESLIELAGCPEKHERIGDLVERTRILFEISGKNRSCKSGISKFVAIEMHNEY